MIPRFSTIEIGSKEEIVPLAKLLGYDFFPIQKSWADWAFSDLRMIERDENGRLKEPGKVKMLLGARGYGKTEAIIFYGCLELLKKNKDLTFIISTRKAMRAKAMVTMLSQIMPKMGFKGRFLFESITLDKGGKFSKQETFKIIPVGTTLKGNHASVMIVDDPLDPSDDRSKAWKDRALKFTQDCQDIADLTIIIGQYVSEDDLYVHYKSALPPENLLEVWHGTIPELDVYWPEKKAQGYSLRNWGLNYEGRFFPKDNLLLDVRMTDVNLGYDCWAFADLSYIRGSMDETKPDYTALTLGKLFDSKPGAAKVHRDFKNVIYPHTKMVVEGHLFTNMLKLFENSIMARIKVLFYDATKDDGKLVEAHIRSLGWSCIVIPIKETRNKQRKILGHISWVNNFGGLEISDKTDSNYLSQVINYSSQAEHDDAPDSLACLISIFREPKYKELDFDSVPILVQPVDI